MNKSIIACTVLALVSVTAAQSDTNSYTLDAMCDTHVHIFEGKAYAYAGHDADPKAKSFTMPDWRVFSSTDLVHWTLETVIDPAATYLGAGNTKCFACDAGVRSNTYYFYFSDGNKNESGVLRGPSPNGPFTDPLGKKPLLPKGLTPSQAHHDPTVFIDDDPAQTPYIVFGRSQEATFYIARLNEDMISLAETPRPIGEKGWHSDQNYLFKRNGIYYLTFNNNRYVTAKSPYGPYESTVKNAGGLPGYDGGHGSYFTWHNQWFRTTNNRVDPTNMKIPYRKTIITYVHFREDGSLVNDPAFYRNGFAYGWSVGRYDAQWPRIEAEWFFAASRDLKRENAAGGFEIRGAANDDYLVFPQVHNLGGCRAATYSASATGNGCAIEIRQGDLKGRLLGSCPIPKSASLADTTFVLPEAFAADAPQTDLCLVFKAPANGSITLDWFRFEHVAR